MLLEAQELESPASFEDIGSPTARLLEEDTRLAENTDSPTSRLLGESPTSDKAGGAPSANHLEESKTQAKNIDSPSAALLEENTPSDHSNASSPTAKLLEEKNGAEKNGAVGADICSLTEKDFNIKTVQALCEKIKKLNERIDDLEAAQSSLNTSVEAVMDVPSEDLRALNNFLLVGTGYTFYTKPEHFNGTFGTVIDPVFLWRYGDNSLFEMKLDITLLDHATNIQLVYGTFDYVVNDWLTVRVGKYSTPLGFVWEKMTTGWINKLPNLPLPYNPRSEILTPPAEVGIDIRGAVPFDNIHFDCEGKIPFVLNYDLWIGNGPDEINGRINLGTNYNDNNNNIAFGSRIGFRFKPTCELGVSCEYGRWNNNRRSELKVTSKCPLYYNAIVTDLHWRFKEFVDILGEFIYTSYGSVRNKSLGIHSHKITQTGGWLQFSSFLYWHYDNCCLDPDIWRKFEAVVRYGFVNSGITNFKGQQWSFGVNYHFSNRVILKNSYDINLERRINTNVFTIQLAYAY